MTGEGIGVIGPRGLLAALTGCALVAAAAAGPAIAQQPRPNPEVLWRAYPLEQPPPRTSAPEQRPRRAQPAGVSRHSSSRWTFGDTALALVALLASGALTRLGLQKWRPAPAFRTRPPRPRGAEARGSRSPPPPGPGSTTAEACWIVCWRATGRAAFYAIARDPDGRQQFIGESPAFTATTNKPLVLDDDAFDALQSLSSRLSDGGWHAAAPIGARGAMWHAQEFRRNDVAPYAD